ncbi:aldolase/citrate lyase family protein [Synechococcus sp. W4D4]|uniref:aldolase/citrate lyase family protein n=1 Tax=Synechococcus sp. W4D4 TaxID=3392294 RepID=UPI0039E86E93
MNAISAICAPLQVPQALKIGGCEAVTDLYDCLSPHISYVVAPMIETAYAARKYVSAVTKVTGASTTPPDFLLNIETNTSFNNIESILEECSQSPLIRGVVFGRVDYTFSLGLDRDSISSERVSKDVLKAAQFAKDYNLDFVVGGAISADSKELLQNLASVHLTRFETRKCVFDSSLLDSTYFEEVLRKAVRFELLWLQSKKNFYESLSNEDSSRIEMLSRRHVYGLSDGCSKIGLV